MVNMKPEGATQSPQESFLNYVLAGDLNNVDVCLKYLGADIDGVEESTGLSALHIAIGLNYLDLVRFLLDRKAKVEPDRRGRWPSTIAALCEASEEICDLVTDAEKELGDV